MPIPLVKTAARLLRSRWHSVCGTGSRPSRSAYAAFTRIPQGRRGRSVPHSEHSCSRRSEAPPRARRPSRVALALNSRSCERSGYCSKEYPRGTLPAAAVPISDPAGSTAVQHSAPAGTPHRAGNSVGGDGDRPRAHRVGRSWCVFVSIRGAQPRWLVTAVCVFRGRLPRFARFSDFGDWLRSVAEPARDNNLQIGVFAICLQLRC